MLLVEGFVKEEGMKTEVGELILTRFVVLNRNIQNKNMSYSQ